MMWWRGERAYRSAVRAERDPRYLRRRLLRRGMIYVACAVLAIVLVATGKEAKELLFGLPIGVAFAWYYLRSALRVKVPTE